MFEKNILKLYKSINEKTIEAIIPIIDLTRKLNNKPKIPLKEKMARIDFPDFSNSEVIMIHGVSVGEVLSLENLITKIKKTFPNTKLVLTTGTLTGQELAHKKYSELADFITYFPLDVYSVVDKFLTKINPKIILIAETELWPNFLVCAKEKNIQTFIINGRISDNSYPSYLKLKSFFKLILECFSGIFCQSEIDKQRFLELGGNKDTTLVMNNLKFEIQKKDCDINLAQESYKTIIAGSTHSGEDEIVIKAFKNIKAKEEKTKLIIAPRHLTRVDEVKTLLEKYNLNYGLRTNNDNFNSKDVIVLDTLGELSKIYSIVDIAFIGGSFNQTGGHNPLEATIFSKPTISGPSIKNFRDIYSILQREGASFVVKNEKEFNSILEKLILDKDFYNQTSQNCENCFQNQQGALNFIIDKLKTLLN